MAGFDRELAIAWYKKNRARTAQLFDLLSDDAYYQQPISLRHPIVFYEGHIPAFSLNTLVKRGLKKPGIDHRLERLFARGIDPDENSDSADGKAPEPAAAVWPARSEVRAFVDEADQRVVDALTSDTLEVPGDPLLDRADAVYTILEHEAMHQETLLYMWHQLPFADKRKPQAYSAVVAGTATVAEPIAVEGATVRLGARRGEITFGWDNEFGEQSVLVEPFLMDRYNVSNADYLRFVDEGGYHDPALWSSANWSWVQEQKRQHPSFWEREGGRWYWRGMFERYPLPLQWPVYVSHAEANAYARWSGGRLPTEAEYVQATTPFPRPSAIDFCSWDPMPVGHHATARSARGHEDLVGNGWEWTSSIFRPFPSFVASASYPEYSADFFDESHYVIKGASTVTARELVRPTFRNWFRPRYPYVYATFRVVHDRP